MKVIKYPILQSVSENGEAITLEKTIDYSEENERFAKEEAYNGEYTVEEDEQMESVRSD